MVKSFPDQTMKSCIVFSIICFTFLLLVHISAIGQNYSFGPPERLSDKVNSPSEESMPLISPDGTRLYFVRTFYEGNLGGKLSGQDIWVSERLFDGSWGLATNKFPNINNLRNNAVIGTNSDETALLLINSYKANTVKIHGIARSIKIGDEWSKPYDIKIDGLESDNSFIGFYINKSEDVLLISMNASNSIGQEDLYISLKNPDGQWTMPQNLGATINTKGFEISPFLSDDGKTLFFASDGHSGYGGSDLFMSRRLYDSWVTWSKPINLGNDINSAGFDAYLTLHDNKEAFFVSTRDGEFADIYRSELVAIQDRKENAEINKTKYKLTETEIQELLGLPVSRTIYFEFESFEVASSSRELIYFLANKLATNFQYSIELIGHTSEEGSDEFNNQLSLNRANEVAKYFMDFGITTNRISTSGVGKSQPLFKVGTETEIAKNRRVEIYFVE
jgi:outer membrane protein OmpA-like peptidoglycan-associated protein